MVSFERCGPPDLFRRYSDLEDLENHFGRRVELEMEGVAWIVLKDGASAEPEELIDRRTETLAGCKVPRHVLFTTVEKLPRTPSGRPCKFLPSERATRELGVASAR